VVQYVDLDEQSGGAVGEALDVVHHPQRLRAVERLAQQIAQHQLQPRLVLLGLIGAFRLLPMLPAMTFHTYLAIARVRVRACGGEYQRNADNVVSHVHRRHVLPVPKPAEHRPSLRM